MLRPFIPALLAVAALPTLAAADFYSGDPYAGDKSWPMFTSVNSGGVTALAYDNFNWTPGAGGGVVDVVGGHFHYFNSPINPFNVDQAFFEIRTGMVGGAQPVGGTGGTLLYTGTGAITASATSFTQSGGPVWKFSIDVTNFTLPAGNYWLGVAIGSTNLPDAGWFAAQTDGTNGIGGPLADNNVVYYQTGNWPWIDPTLESWWPQIVNPRADPSFFINEVPAPTSLAPLALTGLIALRRRRRN